MKNILINLTEKIQSAQKKHRIILIAGLILFVVLGIFFRKSSAPVEEKKEENFNFLLKDYKEEDGVWRTKLENKLDKGLEVFEKKLEELKDVKQLSGQLKEIQEANKNSATVQNERFEALESSILNLMQSQGKPANTDNQEQENPDELEEKKSSINIQYLNNGNENLENKENIPKVATHIPAGSYVKVVLLNGLDVSVGVSAQANPTPVLLKIVKNASLPNKAYSKINGCRMIGSAFGDLSSERVMVRLEKISCVKPNGDIQETTVDGMLSGPDGRNGIKGNLVIRDDKLVGRAVMGGILGGLGKKAASTFDIQNFTPMGSIQSIARSNSTMDIAKQSGAEGIGNAFEMLAKYQIQRAEQVQPIIQIGSEIKAYAIFHGSSQIGKTSERPKKKVYPDAEKSQKTEDFKQTYKDFFKQAQQGGDD